MVSAKPNDKRRSVRLKSLVRPLQAQPGCRPWPARPARWRFGDPEDIANACVVKALPDLVFGWGFCWFGWDCDLVMMGRGEK